MIEKVKWHINRDSAEDKLRDLLKWMSAIKADTVHQVRETIINMLIVTLCHVISPFNTIFIMTSTHAIAFNSDSNNLYTIIELATATLDN